MLVVPKLPFHAIAADLDPVPMPNPCRQITDKLLNRLKLVVNTEHGAIWAPPIANIYHNEFHDLVVVSETLHVKQTMRLTGIAVCNENHQIIRPLPFVAAVEPTHGDQVTMTWSGATASPGMTLEEHVEWLQMIPASPKMFGVMSVRESRWLNFQVERGKLQAVTDDGKLEVEVMEGRARQRKAKGEVLALVRRPPAMISGLKVY